MSTCLRKPSLSTSRVSICIHHTHAHKEMDTVTRNQSHGTIIAEETKDYSSIGEQKLILRWRVVSVI